MRAAREADQVIIRTIVREGRINPFGLRWQQFVIAELSSGEIVGLGQLKPRRAGVVELASIAVRPTYQGQGIAQLIIEHLCEQAKRPLWLMCANRLTPFYNRFGFVEVVLLSELPPYYRRIMRISSLFSFFSESRLAIMVRRE